MKIELRTRTFKNGNRSLYLEYYEKGGERKTESLNLFFIPEKDDQDRRVNRAILNRALKIKAERILGIEKEPEKIPMKAFPSMFLSDWMEEYEAYIRDEKKLSEGTCKTVHTTINVVRAFLSYIRRPKMQLGKIDKSFCKAFLAYMKDEYKNTKCPKNPKPLSDKTMELNQRNLISMLNHAVDEGLLEKNPFYELDSREKLQKTRTSNREYLTVSELKALAEAPTGSPITKQTFLFCCFTGLRHSDMKALCWRDIQKTDIGDIIRIPSMQKTRQSVTIPLGSQAKSWLPDRKDASLDAKVFPDAPAICNADRALKHMAKRAGINKTISFHCSRHTFATLTLTAGGDIYTTSKMLGHTNVHTTEIYADVINEKKRAAVNLLNALF
ncbi:MAG: site-specific integrase [Bacteroidales bacterium]|nr:site-specific integrase [Bacteroidales bacterium]